jgi:hypothetical protein
MKPSQYKMDISIDLLMSFQGIEHWHAIDHNTYDGAPDATCPEGYGTTPWLALEELFEKTVEHYAALSH